MLWLQRQFLVVAPCSSAERPGEMPHFCRGVCKMKQYQAIKWAQKGFCYMEDVFHTKDQCTPCTHMRIVKLIQGGWSVCAIFCRSLKTSTRMPKHCGIVLATSFLFLQLKPVPPTLSLLLVNPKGSKYVVCVVC